MAEAGWFEVHLVLRIDPDKLEQAKAWLEDSGLAEVNRIDVDNQLRRWDGGRPSGVVVDGPEVVRMELETFDRLRRGLHLHEQ